MTFASSGSIDLTISMSRFLASPSVAVLLFLVASITYYLDRRSRTLGLPVVGKPGTNFDKEDLLEGVEEVGI